MTIETKPPSSKFFKLLDKVVEHQTTRVEYDLKSQEHQTKSREIFVQAIEVARTEGLSDFEISTFTRDYLKKKIPETSLRRYLEELKPIEESSTQNPPNPELEENDDKNDTEQEEPEIVVTTNGSQTSNWDEGINENVPTKTSEQFYAEQKGETQEDPKDVEIAYLKEKTTHLEEALKKTEQFVPATQLQEQPAAKESNPTPELQMTDDLVFQYLRDRAKETGNILIIDRVGAGALVQALAQYKNSFGVAELFLRVIK